MIICYAILKKKRLVELSVGNKVGRFQTDRLENVSALLNFDGNGCLFGLILSLL